MEKIEINQLDKLDINKTSENKNFVNTIINKDLGIKQFEDDKLLQLAISKLPKNYSFEIPKTLLKIQTVYDEILESNEIEKNDPILVAIQLPDGFAHFSVIISDILQTFSTNCEVVILGDITYGACCIDDLGCKQLGVHLLVHYGHSCLIPITESLVRAMYIFVDIMIDVEDCAEIIKQNFPSETKLYIMGSIQYNNSVFLVKRLLTSSGYNNIIVPQAKPRSSGEVLGCTSPVISEKNGTIIFICDGRFHMESLMISNPQMTFYQYNPFLKELSLEEYDTELMIKTRKSIINKCFQSKKVGIVFGTLGRQGNEGILTRMLEVLERRKVKYDIILLSEITEETLQKFPSCDYFVQIACPRLSIDWGIHFTKPVITPYEFFVVNEEVEFYDRYPMDYYSYEGGKWSNFYGKGPKNKSK